MSHTCNYGVTSPRVDDDFTDEQVEKLLDKKDDEPVFIGNKKTGVFHQRDCYCVKEILLENKVGLDFDLKDSRGKVYRACCKCFPRPEEVEKLEEAQQSLEDY